MTALPVDASSLLLSAFKVAMLFCAARLALGLLRRSSPGTRHRIASLALAGGLLVPGLAAVVPVWGVLPRTWMDAGRALEPAASGAPGSTAKPTEGAPVVARAGGRAERTTASGEAAPAAPWWRTESAAASIWAAVAAWLLASLALRVAWTNRFVRRTGILDDPRWAARLEQLKRELGIARRVELRVSGPGEMPFTWGVRRPVVVLPAEALGWSDGRSRAVLGHELAHVTRCDVALILLARIACALHWFNPLAWGLHRLQRIESELACDLRALALGMRAPDYADHLLETAAAARRTRTIAPVMAAQAQLEGRIMTILDSEGRRIRHSTALAPLILGLAFLLPVASAGWSEVPSEQDTREVAARSDTAAFQRRLEELNVDPRDLQSLFTYLYDDSPLTRAACVWALGTTADPRVVDPLVSALVDRDARVRQWAVRGFLVRRDGDERAVQPLALAASDGNARVREWIVRTIPHLAGERAATTIEQRLGDEDAEVRQWAVRALSRTHDEIAPELIRARLRDPDAEVREWTVRALAHLGADGLGLDLVERLADENPAVREWTVRTLGDVGDASAVPALIEQTMDPDPEVREWAVRALGALGDPRLVTPLIRLCGDPEAEVRQWAVRVLGDHGDPAALGAIEPLLRDEDEEVREWARRALERLST